MKVLDRYLDQFPAMKAGKLRKILNKRMGFNGRFHPRHEYAEMMATSNKPIQVNPVKRRVYTDTKAGTFFTYSDVTKTFADYLSWIITHSACIHD